jgi:hypothetical protein
MEGLQQISQMMVNLRKSLARNQIQRVIMVEDTNSIAKNLMDGQSLKCQFRNRMY